MPGIAESVILSKKHAGMLDRFLIPRAESSLVLLSNSRMAGLEDHGRIFQGTYAAYQDGDEITGLAAHYWNGMVFFQAPENADRLFDAVVAASGRECTGIGGPCDQVQEVLPVLLKKKGRPAMNSRDTLFSLDLDALVVPDLLNRKDVTCRLTADNEIPAMTDLRIAFMQELTGPDMRATREDEAREMVRYQQQTNNHWILETAGKIVATTAISAGISELVQIGGVYTIPGYRNQGFGRAVVAGSLLDARARDVKKAILFTGTDMPAAQKMYRALGFRQIGEYGLVIY